MWIDAETGVLLKLEETNDKNEVTNLIEVSSIEFNKKGNLSLSNKFNPPADYKDLTKKPERKQSMKSEKEDQN